ncbi:S8 family serine peptidase [Kutzneria sp. 744]|uniref:S8 family serine peptidase n=1 Tax=Kutzneria sp. (strain 744) TaxID=345341 RepID=UPI0003EEB1B7|nr:S8 family serine peptidase [Kutzneria sp. 744]EWM17060.1 serine protease [Kutzneria sp. 744]
MKVTAALFVALVVALFVDVPLAQAAGCATSSEVYQDPPSWAQKLVDPSRIWLLTKGTGQTVAIVGAGVDGSNPQFGHDQVLSSDDLVARPGGVADCDGRGTFAAGIIGAQPNDQTTFVGLAPGAHLLPVRYTAGSGDTNPGDPGRLATAITQAVHAGAGTILVDIPTTVDSPALDGAVAAALAAGSVIVSPAAGTQQGIVSYPTALPGVLGVGAADRNGVAVQTEAGDYIDVAAPGADLVSTSAGGFGHSWPIKDPSAAAAYVAATVALLRSHQPTATPAQIVNRLTLTASRASGGGRDPRLGWGLVDAYTAVTSQLPLTASGPGTSPTTAAAPALVPAAAPAQPPINSLVGGLALGGVALAALAGLITVTIRRGRERGWKVSP